MNISNIRRVKSTIRTQAKKKQSKTEQLKHIIKN